MPFGLRFKRTRRYDISTKNVYMVVVQVLDGSYLECTLNTDSTGSECLEGISQKIELQELQYFGLRYVTKKLQFRWVDLTKPLKKQLEKYAQTSHTPCSPKLYFGVIFYIANAHKIVDDVARYQYYLQLKSDIVDGRLPLTIDQVIRLAAYSLQVEFNDYESDRPAVDYFTDNNVFPKNMTRDNNIIQELMNEILQMYMGLQGMHPGKAEIQYMKEIQMMDGYGMEYYTAKDEKCKELYLGTSYTGIFARYLDGQPPIFFKWTDISRFQQSKKTFEIDTSKSSMQYVMEDSDTAKYLKRMCLLQQKFYKSLKQMASISLSDIAHYAEDFTNTSHNEMSVDPLTQSQTSLQSLNKYGEPKYEQDSRSESVTTDEFYNRSQQSLNMSAGDLCSMSHTPDSYQDDRRASSASSYMSQYTQHQQQQLQHQLQQHYQQHEQYMSDSSNVSQQQAPDATADPNYSSRLAALPAYRQAPSYHAVMEQKMNQAQMNNQAPQSIHNSSQQIEHDFKQNIGNSHIYGQSAEGLAYSQPDIGTHTHTLNYNSPDGQYHLGADVTHYAGHHSVSMYPDIFQDQNLYLQHRVHERPSNLVMQPTYSSPELNTQGLPQQEFTTNNMFNMNEDYVYHYKPPPPYPRASTSTPDLAAQTGSIMISDSPDLISRRHLGNSAMSSHSNLELSLDNLSDTIPEVVQISADTVETETGMAEVISVPSELDDASSDHSNSTFHIKETDSELEESFVRSIPQRQSSKVTVRFVAANKAPPPSTSKEVATKRESFRRMMIARSGSFTPGVLRENARVLPNNRSLRAKDKSSIEEHILESSRTTNKSPVIQKQQVPTQDPVKENVKNVLNNVTNQNTSNVSSPQNGSYSGNKEITRSQSDANKTNNKVLVNHPKSKSVDSSTERQQLLDKLRLSEPPEVSTISENERLACSRERLVDYEDSDSDEDSPQSPIGPLKLAAMNGLTMSRPMVLALMNDETRAPKDERRKILERKLSENLLFKEFEETPKKIPEYDCNVARLPENTGKNRFRDVLPYDGTRVKLNPRKDNPSGYVNASHIKLTVGHRLWWYIATQAPMDNTPTDFWQMIWEQEVEVIAMLTPLMELGRPKCYPYWPQDAGPEHKLVFGDYEVELVFANDSLCYITNLICLRHMSSKKERQVWHLQYTGWPDHGCPDDMYGFLGFLDEIESVQRLAESEEGSGKKSAVVVHCSAGVGRTGVVILTQVMKWCLDNNKEIDLPKALGKIRQQRMYMVQTLGQYDFIHKTLIQYLKNTRLI